MNSESRLCPSDEQSLSFMSALRHIEAAQKQTAERAAPPLITNH
jgi:hypothetical protein